MYFVVSEEHKIEEEGISYRKVFIHCAQERSKRFRRSAMGKVFVKGRGRGRGRGFLISKSKFILKIHFVFSFCREAMASRS